MRSVFFVLSLDATPRRNYKLSSCYDVGPLLSNKYGIDIRSQIIISSYSDGAVRKTVLLVIQVSNTSGQ